MTRREWLKLTALAGASTALAGGMKPSFQFPTDPRHRIGIATYPFRAVIDAPENGDRTANKTGMDLPAFARYVRSQFGVFGIEPLHSHFASMAPENIAELRTAFDAAGVRVINIPVDAPTNLCSPDADVRTKGYAAYRQWIDIAVQLGAPSIRIGSMPRCSGARAEQEAVSALRPVAAYGASKGIVVTLENDDPVTGSAARITGILRDAADPWLRALPDFGNGLLGGDERFNAEAVRQMFRYASCIAHVKDGETIQGKAMHVSLPELFAIAKQAGYLGYYSMESDDGSDPERSTRYLVEQTIALM